MHGRDWDKNTAMAPMNIVDNTPTPPLMIHKFFQSGQLDKYVQHSHVHLAYYVYRQDILVSTLYHRLPLPPLHIF